VRKPLTVLVGVILIIILGFVSFANTSTDLLPSMDLPFSAVITTYPGATPEQIERDISIPLETRLSTLSGISTVQSISNEHISVIILEFTGVTNMDSASLELREALDMLTLPEGASRPMTMRMNPEMLPIMTANLFMEGAAIDELSEFAQNVVAPAIEGVAGVAVVNLSGLVQNQLHVVIENSRIEAVNTQIATAAAAMMAQMAQMMPEGFEPPEMPEGFEPPEEEPIGLPAEMLTVETIAGILIAQNFAMPAGMIFDGDVEYMVRVGDRFEATEEIANLLIFDPAAMGLSGMEPVRLSDVANVFATDDSHLSFTRVNGNPAVMFSIQGQSEFTTADITAAVRNRMDALEADNPGLGFAVLMDQGEMIGIVVGSVLNNLIFGGILAVLVLLIFLRDIRPTLVVAVAIPVSLMLAFTLMYFMGISLNMLSMGGLALTVGMLIDNSIAVIENIFRKKRMGVSAARAAVYGTRQMVGAITAATLTTSAMFLPIVFTTGITRQLFADFALTIAFSLIASLIVAMTVVPAASSALFGKVKKEEGKLFLKIVDGYEKALRWALRFKWPVLIFSVAAFVISFWAINRQGMELFPAMDMPMISVDVDTPEETTFEEAKVIAYAVSERILAIPDVETVGMNIGGGGMMAMLGMGFGMGGGGGGNNIDMNLLLHENRSITFDELSAEIRAIGEEFGVDASVDGADGGMAMMVGDPISLRIEGRELDAIRDTAIALSALLESIPGTANITDFAEDAAQELRIVVDKDAAMSHGLTVAQVFMAAMERISPPERSMNMTLNGRSYEIVVSDGDFIIPERADIENMQIAVADGYIALGEIATVHEDIGFTSISRINRNRFVTISGEIEDGYNVGLVNAEIERALENFVPQACCTVIIGGEAEAMADAMSDLMLMLALGLVFTYLIMVAQFQSLLSPFIIMFTIPLAFTGGFAALMLVGMPMSIVAMIGLILLAGVSINTGIVLISRITQERWEGMSKKDAIIDAGRKRLRPIVMTAISTIFAMSVLALGIGEGVEMMQPMAVATIGGLLYATFMTLFVVPIMYDMFHKDKDITKEDLDTPDIRDIA
ncbi:MAG: efflux RND transporter permease subunit, partial [Clostridiales bacterium]|nr:efflux RND transporter permease subunit [Clostridiales bacterium]